MTPNYYWLLDAGHGGMDANGHYTTAPAKMYRYSDGFTIYEGVVNRGIRQYLSNNLTNLGLWYGLIGDPVADTALAERVQQANSVHKARGNCIYLSIHCNAGGGRGNEVYTSAGYSKSDIVGVYFAKSLIRVFPNTPFRRDTSDGDLDKESKFYVLERTKCPAVLVECGFMDNRKDAELLTSMVGQKLYAEALLAAILDIEKHKPI